jgi:ribonucleotide reductase beta subunit family protein with ferritin-like domain
MNILLFGKTNINLKKQKKNVLLLLAIFIFSEHHQAHSYQPISNDRQQSQKKTFATITMLHEKCHNKS